AHLYLSTCNVLGTGGHSTVYRAPLELRLNPDSPVRSRVRVAAKLADTECGAHGMLRQEARMYDAFPKAFMEDTGSEVLPAIVPKFFGFYVPLLENGEVFKASHEECCGRDNNAACRVYWPSPILLVEECGEPIRPGFMDSEKRCQVHNLFERLHDAGFIQCSPYRRNMLVQPGPLSVPRKERSMNSSSFRIIDFGRGEALSLGCRESWFYGWRDDDVRTATWVLKGL
ncbi:hypothetical protein FKP32DRAFT_1578650, partial [Trametes sanguinea]